MVWLLEQSFLLSFFVLCLITVTISLTGLYFVRKRFPHDKIKDNHDTASVIFNAYGLLYAVVVAFVVYITWNSYDTATMNSEIEANRLMDLFYLSDAYPDTIKTGMQKSIINYIQEISDNEWKMHSAGDISNSASVQLKELWNRVLSVNTGIKIDENICASAFETMKEITESRRLRIFSVKQFVPPIVWAVLLIGGILSIVCTYFFSMKNALPQFLLTACFAIIITVMLYLIYVLDHTFTGTSAISNEPLRLVIDIMQSHMK